MPNFDEIGLPVPERKTLRVFTIYGHGDHLGHVTWVIYMYIHIGSFFLQMLHVKSGFDLPSGFKRRS